MADPKPLNTKAPKPNNVESGINLYNSLSPYEAGREFTRQGIPLDASPYEAAESLLQSFLPKTDTPVQFDTTPPEPSLGDAFVGGYESGVYGISSDLNYLGAAFDKILGDDYSFERNIGQAKADSDEAAFATRNLQSFEKFLEAPTWGGFASQVFKGVGQVSPSLIGAVGGGLTGAVIGALGKVAINQAGKKAIKEIIEEQLKKQSVGPLDKDGSDLLNKSYEALKARLSSGAGKVAKRGAQAGAFGFSYPVSAGTSFAEFDDAGVDLTATRAFQALGIGAPIAALDVAGQTAIAGIVGRLALKKAAQPGASLGYKRLATDIAAAFGKSASAEGLTEVTQEGINVVQRFSVDDSYTAEQAKLRLAEAAFVGFFGGGAFGGAGGAAGSVFSQAREMVNANRDAKLNAETSTETFNVDDSNFGNATPEAPSTIDAQIDAALDPKVTVKEVAYIPESSVQVYRDSPGNRVSNAALTRARNNPNNQVKLRKGRRTKYPSGGYPPGKDPWLNADSRGKVEKALDKVFGGFLGYIPTRGFVISANRSIVKELQEANTADIAATGGQQDLFSDPFEEGIATYLGYTGGKPDNITHSVQVRNKDGEVIFDQGVDESTELDANARARAEQLAQEVGTAVEVNPIEQVLAERATKVRRNTEFFDDEDPANYDDPGFMDSDDLSYNEPPTLETTATARTQEEIFAEEARRAPKSVRLNKPLSLITSVELDLTQLDIDQDGRIIALSDKALKALEEDSTGTTSPEYQAARTALSTLQTLLRYKEAEVVIDSEGKPENQLTLTEELERIAPVKSRDSFNSLNKPVDGKVEQTLGNTEGYATDNYAGRNRDPRKYFSGEGNSAFQRLLELFEGSPQVDLLRRYKDYMSDSVLTKLYDQKVAYPDLDIRLEVYNTPTGLRFFITTEVDALNPTVITYQDDGVTLTGTTNYISHMIKKMFRGKDSTAVSRGARFVITQTYTAQGKDPVVRTKLVPLSLIYKLGRTLEAKRGEYLVEDITSAGTSEAALQKLGILAGFNGIIAHLGQDGNSTYSISVLPKANAKIADAVPLTDVVTIVGNKVRDKVTGVTSIDPIEDTILSGSTKISFNDVMGTVLPAPTSGDLVSRLVNDIIELESIGKFSTLEGAVLQEFLLNKFQQLFESYYESGDLVNKGGVESGASFIIDLEQFQNDKLIKPKDVQDVIEGLQDKLKEIEFLSEVTSGKEELSVRAETLDEKPTVAGVVKRTRVRSVLNFKKTIDSFKKLYAFKRTPRHYTPFTISKQIETGKVGNLFIKGTPVEVIKEFKATLLKELMALKKSKSVKGFVFTQLENPKLKTSIIVVKSSTDVVTLLHELGHVVLTEQINLLFDDNKKLTPIGQRLWAEYKKTAGLYGDISFDNFAEWYSDQTTAAVAKRARNGIDAYFKKIVRLLAQIFSRAKRYKLNETFEQYFDGVLSSYGKGAKKAKANKSSNFETDAIISETIDEVADTVPKKVRKQFTQQAAKILQGRPNTVLDKFTEYAATVTTFYRSLGPAGERLANFWNKKSQTVGPQGFNNLRVVQRNELVRKLEKILGVTVTEWTSQEVIDVFKIAEDDTVATKDLTGKPKQVRLFFESLYDDYITNPETKKPWFKIGRLKNYFPRKLNLAGIAANPELFKSLVLTVVADEFAKPITDKKVIETTDKIVANILSVAYQNEGIDIPAAGIGTVAMSAASTRTLANLTTKTIREFETANGVSNIILESPEAALGPYLYNVVKKVEFEKRGGADALNALVEEIIDYNHPKLAATATNTEVIENQKLRNELKYKLERSFDAQLGRNAIEISDGLKTFNSVTTVWTALTTLALTVFSSFTDLGAIVTRSKEFKNFADLVQDLRNGDKEEWSTLAKDLGVVATDGIGTVWMSPGELDWQQKWASSALDKWFKVTLLTQYTNFMRTLAVGMGKRFIINSAAVSSETNTRYLAEIGLTPEEVNQWIKDTETNGVPSYDTEVGKKVANAIREFADEAVIRPDPGQRPNFTNSPYFQVVFSLKSFYYSYGQTVLGGIGREFKNRYREDGNANGGAMLLLLTAGFMLPLAMIGLETREWVKYLGQAILPGVDAGGDVFMSDHMSTGEYIPEIVDRAGLLGPWTILKSIYDGFGRGDNPFVSQIPFVDMLDQTVFEGNVYRGIPVLNNLGVK
jgi:ribosome-binding protein aMBF1 (putative translation factor)